MVNKKIVYVIPSLETGGAELQTINHVNFLHERNKYVSLVLLKKSEENKHLLKISKDNIFCLDSIDKTYLTLTTVKNIILSAYRLRNILNIQKPTHVIAILPLSHIISRLAKFFMLAFHFKTIKLTAYYRDVDYESTPLNTIPKKLFNYFNSILARCFDNTSIFISNAVHKNISDNFFVKKSLVVPNSLPQGYISSQQGIDYLQSNNIDFNNKFIILIPSRLHKNKGHELFITTFKKFVKNIKPCDAYVILAGAGSEKEKIQSQIKELNLGKLFLMTGTLENQLLMSLYALAKLVVIPSLLEGFGNVAIEGLKQKSLMLTSNAGGLDEIIIDGYNGYKFKKNDPSSLYDKLKYIYTHRSVELIDKNNMGRDFIEKYTLEKQMKVILDYI